METQQVKAVEITVGKNIVVAPLTEEELDAVTVVFHQYETGLREGTIYTRVGGWLSGKSHII